MWLPKGNETRKVTGNGLVAVAIDKDKASQQALKWATENLLSRGKTVVLIHVKPSFGFGNASDIRAPPYKQHLEKATKELFLSFRCYCTRKDIQSFDVVLDEPDVAKAIVEYVSKSGIETLVLGASTRHGFIRFKTPIPSTISKAAPDFCTVYVISKGKISSVRNASRPAPYTSPLVEQIHSLNRKQTETPTKLQSMKSLKERTCTKPPPQSMHADDSIKSPFVRGRGSLANASGGYSSESETDISFVSSGRPSTDRTSSSFYDVIDDPGHPARLSTSSEGFGSSRLPLKFSDLSYLHEFSSVSQESAESYSHSQISLNLDEVEEEMRRLKLELKQTMDMYSTACREALTAKQRAVEMHRCRLEEERRLEEVKLAQEAALTMAEKERAKCKAAIEQAEAARRVAELESQRRLNAEIKALKEAEEMKKVFDEMHSDNVRYRKYTIGEIEAATDNFSDSRKIGEGGYGPVFKCCLDHTKVAVKVLRPDAAQGRSQFRQEIEVLSCIRHPNMVLLLGACPEYGCLVYEYMANGSLEDRLLRSGNARPLSWQHRFRIAAEIATGLLFLHQTKPEPIVHRDLKPANVLLDYNFVSKISDVGLARLVPAVAENVTQYHVTSTAGTFCYIDPEYQQTGMLGVKSDVYSLGIVLLQLITAKPPMGITHIVETALEDGTLAEILDPAVPDWPINEAMSLAKIGIQCAEMRRKDRPDLGKVVLPELDRLREFSEERFPINLWLGGSAGPSPNNSLVSVTPETMSDPMLVRSGSSKSHSSASVMTTG